MKVLAKNPYKQWDKTCTARVAPFSVGEYTFWRKKKQALCITNQYLSLDLRCPPIYCNYFSFHKQMILCCPFFLVPNISLLNFYSSGGAAAVSDALCWSCSVCFDARERLWQVGDCRDKDNGGKESSSVTLPLPPAVWPEHSWGQHMLSRVWVFSHRESWVRPHVLLVVKIERSQREGRRRNNSHNVQLTKGRILVGRRSTAVLPRLAVEGAGLRCWGAVAGVDPEFPENCVVNFKFPLCCTRRQVWNLGLLLVIRGGVGGNFLSVLFFGEKRAMDKHY